MPLSKERSCHGCWEKQQKIDHLQIQVERLRNKLRWQERTAREGFFGSSTPSSKIPIKPNSLEERQKRCGGAKPGHIGHGRRSIKADQADCIQRVPAPNNCPDCGTTLLNRGLKRRTVIDCQPMKVQRKLLELEEKQCPGCGRRFQAKAPGVLAKCLYGNQLLSYVATQHYLFGQTLGLIEKQTALPYSSLLQAMHILANRLQSVIPFLIKQYRDSPVKHGDETGWRTDGQNGYAWLFATTLISIFCFRGTRSAKVAQEILGPKHLKGVLVVDRYNGYNKAPCRLQYCYAHLLRDLQDLPKQFPENEEIQAFVETLAPLLGAAMHLRSVCNSQRSFLVQAAAIKEKIIAIVHRPAQHPAVQGFQNIFREKHKRMYLWATDRRIPADNNLAERNLRPLVIARKVSFGSQSQKGAKTRETLMTILHSLRKQTPDVAARLKTVLDELANNPKSDPYRLLFQPNLR